MSLLGEDDIRNKWTVLKRYGEDGMRWPKSTQCLVKCEILLRKKWLLISGHSKNDCWQKFSNNKKGHAEVNMIRYFISEIRKKEKEEKVCIQKCIMKVVINYSPCRECSEELISLKRRLEQKKTDISLEISFANFYGCQRTQLKNNCIPGLVEMLQNGIKLDVFCREKWDWLLQHVLCLTKYRPFRHLLDEDELKERDNREKIDAHILRCLKEFSDHGTKPLSKSEEESLLRQLIQVVISETSETAENETEDYLNSLKEYVSENEKMALEIGRKWCRVEMYDEDEQQWPRSTIGFLHCQILKKTKWHVISIRGKDDCWKRFYDKASNHAYVQMRKYIQSEVIREETGRSCIVQECKIVIAYNLSPCNECSDSLVKLVRWFGTGIDVEILFANLYECHRNKLKSNCIPGLLKMFQNGIQLTVFREETWGWLLHDVLGLRESYQSHPMLNEASRKKRNERECIDEQIVRCFKKVSEHTAALGRKETFMLKLVKIVRSENLEMAKEWKTNLKFSYKT